MIAIKVVSNNHDLMEYMSFIGEKDTDDEMTFKFENADFLVEHLMGFMFIELRNELIFEITGSSTKEEFIKSFYESFPLNIKLNVKQEIKKNIENTLLERENIFEYEAIKVFRMRKVRESFKEKLVQSFDEYVKNYKHKELASLKSYIRHNDDDSRYESILIRTYENGNIGLFNIDEMNEELIVLENSEEQENIVIQSIICAPKKVRVVDEFNILSRVTVIILTQLFEEKLKRSE